MNSVSSNCCVGHNGTVGFAWYIPIISFLTIKSNPFVNRSLNCKLITSWYLGTWFLWHHYKTWSLKSICQTIAKKKDGKWSLDRKTDTAIMTIKRFVVFSIYIVNMYWIVWWVTRLWGCHSWLFMCTTSEIFTRW